MLGAPERGRHSERGHRVGVTENLEGDVVAYVVDVDDGQDRRLVYNGRLVRPSAPALYARVLAWAETTALLSSRPVSVLHLRDL